MLKVCDDLSPYQIIEFLKKGPKKNGILSIDCVPCKWISFDKEKNKLVTKFLGEPYDEKSSKLLHERVKKLQDPDEQWPVFSIRLKGQASKYFYRLTFFKIIYNNNLYYM